jgi:hypothetical protein
MILLAIIDITAFFRKYPTTLEEQLNQFFSVTPYIQIQQETLFFDFSIDKAREPKICWRYALTLARDLAYLWPPCPHQYYLCATPPSGYDPYAFSIRTSTA